MELFLIELLEKLQLPKQDHSIQIQTWTTDTYLNHTLVISSVCAVTGRGKRALHYLGSRDSLEFQFHWTRVCYIVIQILVGDCWNLGLAH